MSRIKDILKQFPFIYPSAIVKSCKDWIDRQNADAGVYKGLRGHQYRLVIPPEDHQFDLPDLQDGRDATKFNDNVFYSTPPAYLYSLKDVYLYKQMGLVLSNRNALFQEFTHHFGISSLSKFLRKNPFYTYATNIKRIAGTGAVLVSPESHNYYHWLSDVLPRIKLYQSVMGHIDHYCISAAVPEKFLAILPSFGIPMTKILLVNDQEKLHFNTLYVASLPGSEGRSPKWAVDHVRDKLIPLGTDPVIANKKIYFKRGPSGQRKLINEENIIGLLQQHGFDVIDPDDLSITEQINLMQHASVIVSVHGAALSNLLFANKGISVIEFFSTDYFRTDCYFTLSRMLALNYHYIKGNKPASANWGDIEVDETKLADMLTKIGIS
ncbi:glycosyltransferase family 61 protein [Mucilaginibacter myungsuensis]|uniref:Glycosyltransferase family 61 protein n=1 Tax=Mucilaginibacter myungsuensis TaxID=649104 RepID=A0A929PW60_9SPHI|nr:glycosyltransferase family 61 protein [Mucilaginibacter myungsuensis]MBE9660832.1 glycosyltransferase family 61 protein [Mucilaginibacter myungsuensis]MDN3600879.1 glycosyltransferase family 61 protein [Mucilaginibacter myungsuensis]